MSTTVFIVRVFSCEINLTVSRSGENSRSVGSLLLSINFTPDQSGLFWSEQFYSRSVEAFLIGEYILRAALNFLIETFFRASTIKNKTPSTQEDPWSIRYRLYDHKASSCGSYTNTIKTISYGPYAFTEGIKIMMWNLHPFQLSITISIKPFELKLGSKSLYRFKA